MDGELLHRPRSTLHRLILLFLIIGLTACHPKQAVTLALLGDINLGRGVSSTADSLAYLTPYLSTADLALANLESPLASGDVPATPANDYNLCAPAAAAEQLAAWGLDLLTLANNHRDDCASNGVSQTQSVLSVAGLTGLAPGDEPVIRQVNGLRLAFFAFDDVTAPLDADVAASAIRAAREDGALVIVSIHWGLEYQGGADERQKALANQFAEAGATVIWGHHPHVLQPAVWPCEGSGEKPCEGLEPSQGCKGRTLILYSLGNALFDQPGLAYTRQSALVLVTLDASGVKKVEAIPFEIDVAHSRLVAPEAEAAKKILERINLP